MDVDPKGTGDVSAEQEAIKQRLLAFVPRPTFLTFFGGGFQAFWKLREPVFIGGDLTSCEELEAYNIQIALMTGGDHCHNIDRIMRLPGSINVPDARKRKKGRVEVMADLVEFNDDDVYDLSEFTPAPRKTERGTGSSVEISDNPPKITDVNQLGPNVSERTRALIVQGHDPTDPNAHGSRSEAVWAVLCDLARSGVSDDLMAAVMLDKDFGISAHNYDQRRPIEYVKRQIERAKEDAAELDCADNGKPKLTPSNIRLAIAKMGIELKYNLFSNRIMIDGLPGYGPECDDIAANGPLMQMSDRWQLYPTQRMFDDVVLHRAYSHRFHPILEMLDGLDWDTGGRVDTWLIDYAQAPDTPYVRAVSRLFLLAAVKRVRHPARQLDEMLVIESPAQGTNKSSAFRLLACRDEWLTDALSLDSDAKKMIEDIEGKWIVEAPELVGMGRETRRLKAMLSRQSDRARKAYGRFSSEVFRQCVFVGTTDQEDYLSDATGNRRFLPVRVKEFDLEGLAKVRDQLWAEAAALEAKGESIRLPRELWPVAAKEQAARILKTRSISYSTTASVNLRERCWPRTCGTFSKCPRIDASRTSSRVLGA